MQKTTCVFANHKVLRIVRITHHCQSSTVNCQLSILLASSESEPLLLAHPLRGILEYQSCRMVFPLQKKLLGLYGLFFPCFA